MKVAPIGFPKARKCRWVPVVGSPSEFDGSSLAREVFRRKSWVTAMPMEANAREVRSQAKNVRSVGRVLAQYSTCPPLDVQT